MRRRRSGLRSLAPWIGPVAALVALLAPGRASACVTKLSVCKTCISASDTSFTPGKVAISRTWLWPALQPPIAIVGVDRRLRVAMPGSINWQIEPVDLETIAGGAALEVDALGDPMVSYHNGNALLMLATRSGSGWSRNAVETDSRVAGATAIARVAGGVGIAYQDSLRGALRYAQKIGSLPWEAATITTITGPGEFNPSLAVDGATRAISFYDPVGADLVVATGAGTSWTPVVVDADGDVGRHSSIVGGPSYGAYGVAYWDATHGDLKYAFSSASGWTVETVDGTGQVGAFCSAVSTGNPQYFVRILYYDRTNGDLKFAEKTVSGWTVGVLASADDQGRWATAGGVNAAPGGVNTSTDTTGVAYADLEDGGVEYSLSAGSLLGVPSDLARRALGLQWSAAPHGAGGRVRFDVSVAGRVRVTIHDAQGRVVAAPLGETLATGPAEARWDGRDGHGRAVSAGVYFVRVATAGGVGTVTAVIRR